LIPYCSCLEVPLLLQCPTRLVNRNNQIELATSHGDRNVVKDHKATPSNVVLPRGLSTSHTLGFPTTLSNVVIEDLWSNTYA
jgi:hypothetical protein